jgi:signal transduction histidine kinase
LPAAGKIEFSGDGPLLERVIGNLVGNSIKFVPQGGTISLGCAETSGGVRFQVEDTGPGIPEDKREVIFNKYVQMEEHASFGFGLGLAMCRMAVELHKGRIWVESVVGAGSKFIFVIPKNADIAAAGGESLR